MIKLAVELGAEKSRSGDECASERGEGRRTGEPGICPRVSIELMNAGLMLLDELVGLRKKIGIQMRIIQKLDSLNRNFGRWASEIKGSCPKLILILGSKFILRIAECKEPGIGELDMFVARVKVES